MMKDLARMRSGIYSPCSISYIKQAHTCIHTYSMANRSLYRNAPNWFSTPLALQNTGTHHTTWLYSELLAVLYIDTYIYTYTYKGCKEIDIGIYDMSLFWTTIMKLNLGHEYTWKFD